MCSVAAPQAAEIDRKITYTISIYTPSQMKKDEKKRGDPKNTFLQLRSDEPWDTLKAQLLAKISNILKPVTLEFANYGFYFTVPHVHTKGTSLDDEPSYSFMVDWALKGKDPAVSLTIEPHPTRVPKVSIAPRCSDIDSQWFL